MHLNYAYNPYFIIINLYFKILKFFSVVIMQQLIIKTTLKGLTFVK